MVLVIGDATMDEFISPLPDAVVLSSSEQKKNICFPYGEKIPVQDLAYSLGGNAPNVAVGLERLGVHSALVSTIGSDGISAMILENLKNENVDVSLVSSESGVSSNHSVIIIYQGERTIFSYHVPRAYVIPKSLPDTEWVYLTSMAEGYESYYNAVFDLCLHQPTASLIFNLGTAQLRASSEEQKEILKHVAILCVNRTEAELFSSISNSNGKEREMLSAISAMGPKKIVMTDASRGAYAYNNDTLYHVGSIPVTVIEKTGAGDSFNSGFLAAVMKGKSLEDALLWGVVNAASVICSVSAQKGLLHENEIDSFLEKARQLVTIEKLT